MRVTMTSPCALIGIDWGTTSFRAYRIGANGQVIKSRSAPAGILKVPEGDFEGVFEREDARWQIFLYSVQPDAP